MGALVSGRSPLADRTHIRRADLAGHRIWAPEQGTSPEFYGWWQRAAHYLDVDIDTTGRNLGLEKAIADINADPTRVALLPTSTALTDDSAVVALRPLADPVMLFAWSVIWRADEAGPGGDQADQPAHHAQRPRRLGGVPA